MRVTVHPRTPEYAYHIAALEQYEIERQKGCAVLGVFWGSWVRQETKEYKAAIETLARWCAEGKLSCYVQKIYPLAETPAALKALANREVMGKLVVRV